MAQSQLRNDRRGIWIERWEGKWGFSFLPLVAGGGVERERGGREIISCEFDHSSKRYPQCFLTFT